MTPKQQLYIHIGSRKTGTTALQEFFAVNRSVMRKQGLVYPEDSGTAHHRLGQSLLKDDGNPWWFPEDIGDSGDEWKVVLKRLTAPKNLISSELLFRCKKRHILKIHEYTQNFDVKIVVYLRRQDKLIQSEYNQKVKGGPRDVNKLTFEDFVSSKAESRLFHYDKVLKPWADVFGSHNIIVRPYEMGQFYQGTIFADFFHCVLDVEMSADFRFPDGDPNPKLHRIVLEYKRLVNTLLPSRLTYKSFQSALLKVSEHLHKSGKEDLPLASPQACRAILETFHRGNALIAQTYLGRKDGRLFTEPLPDINQTRPSYQSLQKEDACIINHFLCRYEPSLYILVVRAVAHAHCSDDPKMREAARFLLPGIIDAAYESEWISSQSSEKCREANNRTQYRRFEADMAMSAPKKDLQPLRNLYNKVPARLKPYVRSVARAVLHKKTDSDRESMR